MKLTAEKKNQVSSYGTDFNFGFHVSQDPAVTPIEYNFKNADELKAKGYTNFLEGEQPGYSCFIKGGDGVGDEGKIYHTYSTYARGVEGQMATYGWLDMTFLGRQDGDKSKGVGFPRRYEYEGKQ
jgi:predicted dithiol-disulfide oxidoreductase (DUF899 family)